MTLKIKTGTEATLCGKQGYETGGVCVGVFVTEKKKTGTEATPRSNQGKRNFGTGP